MGKDVSPSTSLYTHLAAGGAAGFVESFACHPLDTIKVRMQISSRLRAAQGSRTFVGVGTRLVKKEGVLALYKGLGAVVSGIVPKMAIRFSSFEYFKTLLADPATGRVSTGSTFFAGLFAGVVEAVVVVTPMDVIKIRLQAQRHSMMDPVDVPKYRNAGHAVYTIVREEGFKALYKGIVLTSIRQASNQAVNFTAYQEMKKAAQKYQGLDELPSYQHLIFGGLSGAMGPVSNAPIDTIKTRIQRSAMYHDMSGWKRFTTVATEMVKKEGAKSLYKGLTPRILRVAPGQAITFMVYEKAKGWIGAIAAKLQSSDALA